MRTAMANLHLALDQHTSSPGHARRGVQHLIGDDASISFTRDALLITSELVTNAVIHTGGGCSLNATFDAPRRWLRVEVVDSSPVGLPPVALADRSVGSGGRGLPLVSVLATRWGYTPNGTGKSVWFELEQKP